MSSQTGFTLHHDADLATHNTLRVHAHARQLAIVQDAAALPAALAQLDVAPLVLGQGSNVLFATDHADAVLLMDTRGVQVEEDDTAIHLAVAAGERWDDLVRWTLGQGWAGLENLILIPGTVGAAPIQNIGAYGVEVAEFVEGVEAWDTHTETVVTLTGQECRFGYRDSLFKHTDARYIVTAVRFALPRQHTLRLEYADLRQALDQTGTTPPTPYKVAEAVRALRTRKLPDPAVIGNAGSFFKNPVVGSAQARSLQRQHPDMMQWPLASGEVKLSAGWLIDRCGFKGLREGDAGISNRHALVLVNHGQATGAQLWHLAERVMRAVADRFDVRMEPEPRIVRPESWR